MGPSGAASGFDRLRRRFGFDHNALRRDVDRRQWMLGIALLMLFLSLAPPLCAWAGRSVYASGVRAERQERATRHEVSATVLRVEDMRSGRKVTVTWREPDGTARTGSFTAFHGGTAGQRREVWVGPSSQVTDEAPRHHTRTVGDTLTVALGSAMALGMPLLGLYLIIRYRCDQRRYRLWDAEWARFGTRRIP
ncbi:MULTISPECIES: hypothetical protein [Actinomadura]|uniref:DUF3592 domain-containing protein n=1 Tax=Actinomadura litoris TaxID=2678616 RepID=A0A7K1LDM6_9ACTN|nr:MULTISPECIES: hypothetical protein [Actinomadura]MBT2210218.1 hypothetical protein [Actinomadura sp. NEAU-AAG7]MUN42518.1 hypothetical protein [Actinomadura litoris]